MWCLVYKIESADFEQEPLLTRQRKEERSQQSFNWREVVLPCVYDWLCVFQHVENTHPSDINITLLVEAEKCAT